MVLRKQEYLVMTTFVLLFVLAIDLFLVVMGDEAGQPK
jgi:hypothetical protein